ncbi:hypothetical protein [Catellatospora methionotrophica]|uniref:hypothetical protein n=1 Tax=Catellatospora methionotrophica TaxID=121620 RepID=UPI0033F386C5
MSGYLWVDRAAPEQARVGGRIRMPALSPPWLVVYETPERVLVNRWPGRLLRVRAVPATSEPERAALAAAVAPIRPGAGYTHATSVDVLEELPPGLPFGAHGDAVARVLDAARALDEATAYRLAAARHRDAPQACRSAWQRWLAGPRMGGAGSPIGSGSGLLHQLVRDSARARGGPQTWTVDGDGEETVAEPWESAYGALRAAALAYGAPDLSDAAAMATAWNVVYGPMA